MSNLKRFNNNSESNIKMGLGTLLSNLKNTDTNHNKNVINSAIKHVLSKMTDNIDNQLAFLNYYNTLTILIGINTMSDFTKANIEELVVTFTGLRKDITKQITNEVKNTIGTSSIGGKRKSKKSRKHPR